MNRIYTRVPGIGGSHVSPTYQYHQVPIGFFCPHCAVIDVENGRIPSIHKFEFEKGDTAASIKMQIDLTKEIQKKKKR